MIDKISSWASGLIVAVIIGTIIEMLLPDNKNKKYVKVVIGLFIIYTIMAPIIGELDNIDISFNDMLSEYSRDIKTEDVSASVDDTFKQTYKQNIETDIKAKLNDLGYTVNKINTNINFEDDDNYGTISSVTLKLKDNSNSGIINNIEEVEISVGNKDLNSQGAANGAEADDNTDVDKSAEIDEIKKYLNENYGIDINNIYIDLV